MTRNTMTHNTKEHRIMSDKWDLRFLELADCISKWSKDPDRGVGCVIASPDRRVCATGFNGLPSGVEDHPDATDPFDRTMPVG